MNPPRRRHATISNEVTGMITKHQREARTKRALYRYLHFRRIKRASVKRIEGGGGSSCLNGWGDALFTKLPSYNDFVDGRFMNAVTVQ